MLVGWCYLCWWSKETVDHLLLHCTAVSIYEALPLDLLGFHGCHLKRPLIYFLVGKIGLASIHQIFGT